MRRFVFFAAMAAAVFAGSRQAAHANVAYTSYSVLNNQNVTINLQTGSELGGSGQVTLNGITNDGVSGASLKTWCVDVYDDLQDGGVFSSVSQHASTDPLFGKIDALISHATPQLLGQDYNASAAMQVAIWEVEYGSAVSVSSWTPGVDALATTYVTNVQNETWQADPNTVVSVLHGARNQDQAYLTKVPEPASMAMLVTGLIGVGLIGRRRASARMK